jgi:hypothetical protein
MIVGMLQFRMRALAAAATVRLRIVLIVVTSAVGIGACGTARLLAESPAQHAADQHAVTAGFVMTRGCHAVSARDAAWRSSAGVATRPSRRCLRRAPIAMVASSCESSSIPATVRPPPVATSTRSTGPEVARAIPSR